jgi:hypothetical protein
MLGNQPGLDRVSTGLEDGARRHRPLTQEAVVLTARCSRLTRIAAAALAAGALAAPAAQAAPAPEPGGNRQLSQVERQSLGSNVELRTIHRGFEWSDAALGAGAATVVLLVGVAGMSAVSHRHGRLTTAR